jgi:hypothetical protein
VRKEGTAKDSVRKDWIGHDGGLGYTKRRKDRDCVQTHMIPLGSTPAARRETSLNTALSVVVVFMHVTCRGSEAALIGHFEEGPALDNRTARLKACLVISSLR